MDNYHITKGRNKWKLTKEGSENALKNSDTKQEIIGKMSDYMNDKTGLVKIHTKNGRIHEERTYQRKDDPSKRKG